MIRLLRTLPIVVLLALAGGARGQEGGVEFFEKHIRPVLVERCYECHGEKKQKGGLRLDSREALLQGGESGAALVPGDVEASLLVKAVRYLDKDLQMPPPKDGSKKLPSETIAAFETWVKMGAPGGENGGLAALKTEPHHSYDYVAERKKWAFRQPQAPPLPEVQNTAWPQGAIDRFILGKLEEKNLAPAPPAEPATLLRRITFDLTGLPPTPEEIEAFERACGSDPSTLNLQLSTLIDRLLASPAYGERWARHWLDVVRYADSLDSRGFGNDGDILDAWRYRDWVVEAFNRDLPYDEFIVHQVAGDILAAQQWDAQKVVATGMYAIGNWGNGDADKEKVYSDIVDDQIDVTGRAFLGLTIGCARCHDHKFDPLSTADYYSLAGIFFSSHILAKFQSKGEGEKVMRVPLLSAPELAARAAAQQRLAEIAAQLAGGLQPLTEVQRDVAEQPGLHVWRPKGADNPSIAINTTQDAVKFSTVALPARAIALHPGPKLAVSAVWRSPVAGRIRVSAELRDADPNCGDGVAWELRHFGKKMGGGEMNNGAAADFPETEIAVQKGELVQLVIGPRGEYTCDSTQVDFLLRSEDGTVWDLRDTLASGGAQGHDGVWWICSGEGVALGEDVASRGALENERQQLAAAMTKAEFAHALQEGGIPATPYEGFRDARIHVRGRYDRLGEVQPRVFPALLAGEDQAPITAGSGRLELARWLASAENPLTARVLVNRLWQHHFGEGLVRTPNNFGKLGTPPTHPELLDFLATEFVKSGWSLKAMHRAILLSATYQQASVPRPETLKADPENLLFGRMNRRRLEAETLRDSLLAAAGQLDRKLGGSSTRDLNTNRRTLYVATIRSDRATYQSLFDAADPNAIVEKRTASTVAPQALFLLNHPFALAQAKALAARFAASTDLDALYHQLFARPATAEEKRLGLTAIAKLGLEPYCHALLCSNEFIYID